MHPFRYGLASSLLLAVVLFSAPLGAQGGEYPQTILASTSYSGPLIVDLTYDPTTNQVYAIQNFSQTTLIYNATLTAQSSVTQPFTPGSFPVGITADPATGTVYWLLYDGISYDLWSASSVTATASPVGPVGLPPGGAGIFGIDHHNSLSTIYLNDAANARVLVNSNSGAFLGACPNAFGPSLGISHRRGTYVDLTRDALGAGAPTHWTALDTSTCQALDAVGIPFYAPGFLVLAFDAGAPTATGGPTMIVYESSTGTLLHVTTHRSFIRADANSDGAVDLSDAIFVALWLFGSGAAPGCMDAADANDFAGVNIADVITILGFLFNSVPLPPPTPGCGQDPTPDALRCDAPWPGCP